MHRDRSMVLLLFSRFTRSHVILLIRRLPIPKRRNTFGSCCNHCQYDWNAVGLSSVHWVGCRWVFRLVACLCKTKAAWWMLSGTFKAAISISSHLPPSFPKTGICSLFWSGATEPHPSTWQHMVQHCSYLYSQINKTIPAISFTLLSFTVIILSSIHISSICV